MYLKCYRFHLCIFCGVGILASLSVFCFYRFCVHDTLMHTHTCTLSPFTLSPYHRRLLRGGQLIITAGTKHMERYQTPGNQVFDVFDTIPLIPLQSFPQARPPKWRCHQPPVLHTYIHTRRHAPTHANTHLHFYTHIHAHIHTHKHPPAHTRVHPHLSILKHVHFISC
jgi:hypothetical protein